MVSVIVPVWNVEKYIDQCIVSLSSQTYTDIEVIFGYLPPEILDCPKRRESMYFSWIAMIVYSLILSRY